MHEGDRSESQLQHYDSYAHHYVSSRRNNLCNRIFDDYWIEQMFAALPTKGGHCFLDPMCGGGELVQASMSRFRLAIGCDISGTMTRLALASPGPPIIQSDITQLPFQNNSFDAVMIRGGLHHVHQRLPEALSEIHRVLKPHGYLVASEPIDDLRVIRLIRKIMYRASSKFDHTQERAFLSDELLTRLRSAGLDVVSYRPFGFIAYALIGNTDVLGVFSRIRNYRLIRCMVRLDSRMGDSRIFRGLGLACVVVVRKGASQNHS